MRIACIIQAHIGSTRLPNKVNADIGGRMMRWHVNMRACEIGIPIIWAWAEDYKEIEENDVLARYFEASQGFDAIMRITSDCPLLDPFACRRVLEVFKDGHYDYVANDWKQLTRYPDGMGCEIFKRHVLKDAYELAKDKDDREHVTPWIKRQCKAGEYMGFHVTCPTRSKVKFSVDTQEDLDRVRAIDAAQPKDFSLAATLEAYERAKAQNNA